MRPVAALVVTVAALTLAAGCGTTERSGSVGDTLSANGLEATVEQVDQSVPVPESDVTGLSQPSPGSKLVGVRVKVCSDHGGAIGPYDFGLETSSGESGELKYPAPNYDDAFEVVRTGCGDGWVVFQIPQSSQPGKVTFGFEDTGSAEPGGDQNRVDAKFSWAVD